MVQVVITYGAAVTKGQFGAAPVMSAYNRATEELSTSGTSATTTATAGKDDVTSIKNNGSTAVWAVAGSTPVATVGAGHFILPGEAFQIGGMIEGHKVAVIDDA